MMLYMQKSDMRNDRMKATDLAGMRTHFDRNTDMANEVHTITIYAMYSGGGCEVTARLF